MATDITCQSGKGSRLAQNVSTRQYRAGWEGIFGGRKPRRGQFSEGLAPGPAGSNPVPAAPGLSVQAEPRYRMLSAGEVILDTDEFRFSKGWGTTVLKGRRALLLPNEEGCYRRRLG